MRYLKIIFTVGAVTLFSFACGYESVSTDNGGTGTETVNTFAMLPDGTPASGAVVRIIDARWWLDSVMKGNSPVLQQTVADKRGLIKLQPIRNNEVINLQIDHTTGARVLQLTASDLDLLDTVRLRPHASLSGAFDATGAFPLRVLLSGTVYETPVDKSGSFNFTAVAPGSYTVVSVTDSLDRPSVGNVTALTLEEGKTIEKGELSSAVERLLIDNFESGVGPTSLGRIFPVLGWYVLSDSLYYYWNVEKGQWSKGVSNVIGHSPIYYDSVAINPAGKAFFFSTILDTQSRRANALIGIQIKSLSSKGVDLSDMKGFSVCASGKGTIGIRFESAGLDSVSSMLYHYAYPLKLSENMRQYNIPVDSLRIMGPSDPAIYSQSRYPWATESKRVLRIEFEFSPSTNSRGDSLYCVIDDFFLEGVSLGSLLSSGGK